MQLLVDRSKQQAEQLRDIMMDNRDAELQERIDGYVEDLVENAEAVSDSLDDAQFGTFDVIWGIFRFNYSWKIVEARQIKTQHQDAFSEGAHDIFDEMIELLKLFGPAHEHFKTLYFQWELVNLSRALLYIAIPALVVVGSVLMNIGPNAVSGTTLGIDNLVWVASAAYTIGLAPFVVLVAYVLRIATLAKRTLAIGPFILRETDSEEE